jgi:hypothetical protein
MAYIVGNYTFYLLESPKNKSPKIHSYPDMILPKAFIPDPADTIIAPCDEPSPKKVAYAIIFSKF